MSLYNQIPFLRFFLPFILGIFAYSFFAFRFDLLPFLIILFALLVCIYFRLRKRSSFFWKKTFALLCNLFFIVLGLQACYTYTHKSTSNYNNYLCDKPPFFTGYISDIPQHKAKGIKTEITLLSYGQRNKWKQTEGQVFVYFDKDSASLQLKYGNIIVFKNKLHEIEPPMNPFEFNYRDFLARKNIFHQALLQPSEWRTAGHYKGNPLLYFSLSLKNYLIDLLRACAFSPEQFSIASALLLGYDDEISKDLITSYAHSGTLHVLSVSGLHVGIVYMLLNFMLGFKLRNKKLKIIKCVLIIASLCFYALLSGLSPSVLRATAMFSMIVIGQTFFKTNATYNTLLLTAFFILLFKPLLIYDVGFQLSYLAVAGIFYFQPRIYRQINFNNSLADKIWALTAVSIAAQMTTFPISLFYFHQFPVLFAFTNLIIIPLSTLIMYAGLVLLIFSGSKSICLVVAKLLAILISAMNELTGWFEKIPGAYIDNISLSAIETILWYLFVLVFSIAVYHKSYQQIVYSLWCLVLVCSTSVYRQFISMQNNSLVVYQVKKQTVADIYKGNEALCFASPEVNKSSEFHYLNNRIENKISSVHQADIHPGLTCIHDGKTSIIIANNYQPHSLSISNKLSCDYLIVCGKATKDIDELIRQIKTGHMIVDGSLSKNTIAQLKSKELNFPVWITNERGAYCVTVH